MIESSPEEKIVRMAIPFEELPKWAKTLYDNGNNGLTKKEVLDITNR